MKHISTKSKSSNSLRLSYLPPICEMAEDEDEDAKPEKLLHRVEKNTLNFEFEPVLPGVVLSEEELDTFRG